MAYDKCATYKAKSSRVSALYVMIILLKSLWGHIHHRRRLQLGLLFFVMILSAFAELFSVGMVIPFLGMLSSPQLMHEHHFLKSLSSLFGFQDPQELFFFITLVFLVAVVFSAAIRFLTVWLQAKISLGIVSEVAVDVYSRTLHQPYAVHISRNSSEIISGVLSKVGSGVGGAIGPLLSALSSGLIATTILAGLVSFEPVIALTSFLGFGIAYTVIALATKRQLEKDSSRISQASNEVIKVLQEGLGGVRDILLDGTQPTYVSAYKRADLRLRNAQASIQIISTAPRYVIESLGIVVIAMIAYSLSSSPESFVAAIPLLGALAIGAQKLLPVLQQVFSSWALLRGAQAPLRDVLDLLDQPMPEFERCTRMTASSKGINGREICLEHVWFRYSSESPYVLRDICLSLPRGEMIGLIGTTGSGKSTLLDVLMGLLIPNKGNLMDDNRPITSLNMRSWQAKIAHVPQSIFLSDATIAENIAFGLPFDEVDFERVKYAAHKAQISEVIESWEKRYETRVGERGVKLSGGQRQRIGIARALYKQADIIIFDEATSALDNETERAVMKAIDGLGDNLTILIVAHRLTTLRNCSQIVELANGELKRIGTYSEIVGTA